ncbi:MAG: anthranilate phosphoribosyltransferase [bacterium]|nr:anthranilate phosphoribosyltransferase [bacterium]MCX7917773.1 anthranilate phosphoribosyltransferase [bacterium]MDW8164658.1 anthranilate phosphoribosyltransferase [Candidatus Omnitrophota bacterium]
METIFKKLFENKNLTEKETYEIFNEIMEGRISPVKTGVFLTLLRVKKESPEEILGAVKLLRDKMRKIRIKAKIICDTCGTGGDYSGTFNISTASAIVASSFDLKVAKHGNRSVTSLCGSADVLEFLGYKIDVEPDKSKELLIKYNFAFLFAPLYHQTMKNVIEIRKELGFRTIFNIIGPLCNPAFANYQIMGVNEYSLLKIIPYVFKNLGIKGYIFHSEDGLDEITLTGKTYIVEVSNGIREFEVSPEDFGLKRCKLEDLKGGSLRENAEIILNVLRGKEKGPKRDIVCLNTSFLLKLCGFVRKIEDGIKLCDELLEKEIPYIKLNEIINFLNK